MAYIYKITNIVNGKIYIGQTSLTPEKRFNKHLRCYKSNSCPKLYNAIKKYGKNNFIVETICETNNPSDDEKYWIQYYDSVNKGYNVSFGGDGESKRSIEDETKIIDLYNKLKSIRKVYKETGYSRDYISNVLLLHNIYISSRTTTKIINKDLIISKYKEYKEVLKVSKELNISEKTIRKYLRESNVEIFNHKNDKYNYIMCDPKTHEELKIFNNRCDIKNYLNLNDTCFMDRIERVIKGERKTYNGYFWKKEDK